MQSEMPDFGRCREFLEKKKEKFDLFFELLTEYNARYNLTAIVEREEVEKKHFLDSLAGEFLFPEGALVYEVGSGAGFPSLPLAIVREDLKFVLIESTGKKCDFLRIAAKELCLNAEVLCTRAETLGRGAGREQADVCVARAVAPLPTLAEYCLPLVKKGGKFIAYKGTSEKESAKRAVSLLGGGREKEIAYFLPGGDARTLYIAEKVHPTPQKYPRGQGAERKDPL